MNQRTESSERRVAERGASERGEIEEIDRKRRAVVAELDALASVDAGDLLQRIRVGGGLADRRHELRRDARAESERRGVRWVVDAEQAPDPDEPNVDALLITHQVTSPG